jgi:hypothetical protein
MLLYGSVFDGAVTGVDFPLFSKKPCQVNFLKNLNYFHFHGLVGSSHRDYVALTL